MKYDVTRRNAAGDTDTVTVEAETGDDAAYAGSAPGFVVLAVVPAAVVIAAPAPTKAGK